MAAVYSKTQLPCDQEREIGLLRSVPWPPCLPETRADIRKEGSLSQDIAIAINSRMYTGHLTVILIVHLNFYNYLWYP